MKYLLFLMLCFFNSGKTWSKSLKHIINNITPETQNDKIIDDLQQSRDKKNKNFTKGINALKEGPFTTLHKEILVEFRHTNKRKIADALKEAIKNTTSQSSIEEQFIHELKSAKLLPNFTSKWDQDQQKKQGFGVTVRFTDYIDGANWGILGWSKGDAYFTKYNKKYHYDLFLQIALGPGISFYTKAKSYAAMLCVSNPYFYGLGVDGAFGIVKGISFGSWIGTGICNSIGFISMYGAHLRASFSVIDNRKFGPYLF